MKKLVLAILVASAFSAQTLAEEVLINGFEGTIESPEDAVVYYANEGAVHELVTSDFASADGGKVWDITFDPSDSSDYEKVSFGGSEAMALDLSDYHTIKYSIKNTGTNAAVYAMRLEDSIGATCDFYLEELALSAERMDTLDMATCADKIDASDILYFAMFARPWDTINTINVQVEDVVGVKEDTTEPPVGDITVVESFSDMDVGTVVDNDAASLSNMVSSDYSSDNDGKSWKIDFDASHQGTSMWGEWDWSARDTFEFDVINNSGEDLAITVKLIAQNTDWGETYNLYGGETLSSSEEPQTIKVDLDSSDAGANFTKGAVGGIQFMLDIDPSSDVAVYFDNILVSGQDSGTTPPNPDPDPEYPETIGKGGSFGSLGLFIISALAFWRRRK
ncbi:hypothetical protein BCU68_10635 [Vibrio sp. 10N.286.49.B3]|uniref:hypothetical protein n=1 Tax=Vibrio sp. 10N.286.49.B3 TaxID=1880855 RepID=UPI000C81F026|nr:hypothetical protein [Vibrio sp. 10N.286.49.B3]PMH45319.1 hypothetical protein BCU68_10635 [Vibrio sp. 10N.286.49.B3]